jgi:hypothetical protein
MQLEDCQYCAYRGKGLNYILQMIQHTQLGIHQEVQAIEQIIEKQCPLTVEGLAIDRLPFF